MDKHKDREDPQPDHGRGPGEGKGRPEGHPPHDPAPPQDHGRPVMPHRSSAQVRQSITGKR